MSTPRLDGFVDGLPHTRALAGWARSSEPAPGQQITIIVVDEASGERLGHALAERPRADIGLNCGFQVGLKRPVSVEDLYAGRVVVSARLKGGPQWPLRVMHGLRPPLRELDRLPADFHDFCFRRGMALQLGGRAWSDLELEAPLTLAARSVGARVSVGAFTGIYGHGAGFLAETTIGRFCSVADGFCIGPDDHPQGYLSSSMHQYVPNVHGWDDWLAAAGTPRAAGLVPFTQRGSVEIGHDVWIGANVIIRRGVSIGHGAVVGAGAVVVSDVAPYTVVGGVPARPIRQRFPDAIVERLLALRWWNYNVMAVPGLRFDRIEEAVDRLEDALADGSLAPLPVHRRLLGELHGEWHAGRRQGRDAGPRPTGAEGDPAETSAEAGGETQGTEAEPAPG